MAEYVNVMEQKRRMCNSYALCSMGCPLNDIDFCNKNSGEKTNAVFPEVERRVMSWAVEHPEPIYPTWIDWLMSEGVIPDDYSAIHSMKSGVRAATFFVTSKAFMPIPADIAQKLGIEPKEG